MLDERKAKGLEMLHRGESITAICKEIGISRVTFYAWMKNDLDFIRAREQMEGVLLEQLSTIALMEAEDLLLNGKSHEKVQMIQQILKLKHDKNVNVNIQNDSISLDEMLSKIK